MVNPRAAFVASKLSAIDKSNTPKLLKIPNSITFMMKPVVTNVMKFNWLATGMTIMNENTLPCKLNGKKGDII